MRIGRALILWIPWLIPLRKSIKKKFLLAVVTVRAGKVESRTETMRDAGAVSVPVLENRDGAE
jgi:hypothetical protein